MMNVRYIMKFFSAHGVYLSKKPKQTHCGSHNKAWYLSGAMMSFMASGFWYYIRVHTWPSGISWGSDRHVTVDHCLRLKIEPSSS